MICGGPSWCLAKDSHQLLDHLWDGLQRWWLISKLVWCNGWLFHQHVTNCSDVLDICRERERDLLSWCKLSETGSLRGIPMSRDTTVCWFLTIARANSPKPINPSFPIIQLWIGLCLDGESMSLFLLDSRVSLQALNRRLRASWRQLVVSAP